MHGWFVEANSHKCGIFNFCDFAELIFLLIIFNTKHLFLDFFFVFCFEFVASGKAAEFGRLKDGYMFESSTGLSRM